MPSSFLPDVLRYKIDEAIASGDDTMLFELLVQPLHEELYKKNDFNFLDELSDMQQLLLSYDYVRAQVGQGGFIQFLVNGYAPLLINMPEWLNKIGAAEMAQLIDDVLKVYVLNIDYIKKEISVEDFGKLYEELKEFEALDKRYEASNPDTISKMMEFAKNNMGEFIKLI